MTTITLDLPSAALLLLLVVLVYMAEVLWFWWKLRRQTSWQELAGQVQELQEEVQFLKVRLSAMQAAAQPLAEPELAPAPAAQAESSYNQAIRMAQLGADADALMVECQLSRAEADLIVAIYRGVYKG
ncbi:DUF2802 domain-containing protein [Chitinibacter tainanensis]|uniref:DUF2802 domain-containing protein n=1 Tax=Chitinibacter tainanensis TaxID=230667 RepID=UPI002357E25F|nr:DUF2802 domain-containing protein [Chitinibacter tainanensis]